ncbi:hypothetical protein [Amycolatopsis alkalitolerans]|uniref:hypothetical protein n=1 Tax=Amycolatopsis alkalitolerans TaxID=2547244 RepID=UPI001F2C1978|nr:hypothetical protein [Amycolatopsis alkalitolerans]
MSPATFDALRRQGYLAQLKSLLAARRPGELEIIPLDEAVAALGKQSEHDEGYREVPVAGIVGTVARAGDFDREFRPRNRKLRERWDALAALCRELPPVSLVRLGELYFVMDGHHRVSVARARDQDTIRAKVHAICTIACAHRCLTLADLPSKTAERMFLERVPLPDDVRTGLWLDEPAQWLRLAESAEAWGFRNDLRDRCALAQRWWEQEVLPVVTKLRARGVCLPPRDVEAYVRALANQDMRQPLPHHHLNGSARRCR